MTEHSKIDRPDNSASLFERADAAFGLDNLGPAAVPSNLPKAKRPPQRPVPTQPKAASSVRPAQRIAEKASEEVAAPKAEPAVERVSPGINDDGIWKDFVDQANVQEIKRQLICEIGVFSGAEQLSILRVTRAQVEKIIRR